jgi:hypothetical protein
LRTTTEAEGASQAHDAAGLSASYGVADKSVDPRPGSFDLPADRLVVSYQPGDKGDKTLEFEDDGIAIRVRHSGAFTEWVPLVQASDHKQAGFTLEPQTPAELSTQHADIPSG